MFVFVFLGRGQAHDAQKVPVFFWGEMPVLVD